MVATAAAGASENIGWTDITILYSSTSLHIHICLFFLSCNLIIHYFIMDWLGVCAAFYLLRIKHNI